MQVLQRPFTSLSQTKRRVATLCKAGKGNQQMPHALAHMFCPFQRCCMRLQGAEEPW